MIARTTERNASELRQDPVTGKWVVIAKGRARRTTDAARLVPASGRPPAYLPRCPFCNLEEFPQSPDTLILPLPSRRGRASSAAVKQTWRVRAFPNKFPAFVPHAHPRAWKVGPYSVVEGAGHHEVIIVRPHNGFLSRLSSPDARLYVRAWRDRYRTLMVEPSVSYIQIIENHGPGSGGSLEHAHAQLFAIPVLPSDEVLDFLHGAERYVRENGTCAYCDILEFEREVGTRIVAENERFLVLAPFAARVAYEQWVVPKAHAPGFEQLSDEDLPLFADAVQTATGSLERTLHDPPYNLYVYSAPCDTEGYVCEKDAFPHFHWHVEILPRLSVWAGFELATGMEISSVLPEDAAVQLRAHAIGGSYA
jgi:UDPglucose--hexose-1-phosphate uridylyltransferase